MRLVVIDRKSASIEVRSSTLRVDGVKVPLRLVDTVLVVGDHTFAAYDLLRLTQAGVSIIFVSANQQKTAIMHAITPKNAELKMLQYRAFESSGLVLARFFLKQKILRHAAHLRDQKIVVLTQPYFDQIDQADDLDKLLGIEGAFSRLYFRHYFGLFPPAFHKGKRSRRPPKDPLNALLSWFYTLTYHLIALRLIGAGFETGVGFLHRPFRNHMALASDFLEIYRARINELVRALVDDAEVTLEDFSRKNGAVYLRFESRLKLHRIFREWFAVIDKDLDRAIGHFRALLHSMDDHETAV